MNARIISPPPSVGEMGSSGGILAIIEITPDHFLIGIIIDYDIADLIKIRIPVEAFFSFTNASHWHFYLGQRTDPVSVDVLGLIKGTGYLIIKGDGLDALPAKGLPAVTGFAIGAGAAASFTWGDTDIGLYLRIAGGFDAVIGFDPFLLAGRFDLSGELRLFIISIGASAELDILVVGHTGGFSTHIHGEACGHVDFFFFEVEGCVDITLGSDNTKPDLPDLVQKLSVKSRSPALLVGTGVDRPIDTSLGEGLAQDAAPAPDDARLPIVPIDSVLVLGMALPPQAPGLAFAGAPVTGSTGQAPGSFVARGSERFAYAVSAVTLERAGGGPALLGTNAPATWWLPNDASSENVNAQLALLTWEPDPATKAIEKTDHRKEQIKQRWSRVCQDAAPPARVLWTFLDERLGPSTPGWDLEGTAWPDPPGTRRKQPPDATLLVTEAWRSGDAKIDALRGIIPAMVVGARIQCADRLRPARPLADALGRVQFDPDLARQIAALTAAGSTSQLGRIAALAERGNTRLLRKAAFAEAVLDAPTDPVTVFGKLAGGGSVSRQEVGAAFLAPATAQPNGRPAQGRDCQTRVLEAPIFDDRRLIVFGNQQDTKRVGTFLAKAGIKHGPLNDVVVLHTGPFADATLLLFVRRNFLQGQLVARTLDVGGAERARIAVGITDNIAAKPLPPAWTDAAGPWARDVRDVLGWSQDPRASGYIPVWVTMKGSKQADRIEIGVIDTFASDADAAKAAKETGIIPPYFLGAADALRISETVRAESEETEIKKEREVLTQILGPGPTDDAYLVPGQLYKVTATWTGQRESGGTAGKTQAFWFRTDATPPDRLDPWVLLTTPADGEAHSLPQRARADRVQHPQRGPAVRRLRQGAARPLHRLLGQPSRADAGGAEPVPA